MTSGILVSMALLTALQASPAAPAPQQPQQACVADAAPTPEQKARRTQGVRLARTIHNLQVNQPGARTKKYLSRQELGVEPPSGWEVTLDVTSGGYWFMVKDTTDPCGFAFMSNQEGVIFEARPLR